MAKTGSLADALHAKLEQRIRSGALAPGSRLPTQKQIAEDEDVSRTVVREAVARLEAQGIAVARQGSGVFVAEDAHYQAFQITRDDVRELVDVIKLLEMRLAIEAEMAAFAASRRTLDDIGAMQAALHDMATRADDPVASAEADSRFHLSIAHATRNENFPRFIGFLGTRLVPPRNLYLRDQSDDVKRAYVEKVRREHDAILSAIIRMDVEGARAAARDHMRESLSRHTELGRAMGDAGPASTPG